MTLSRDILSATQMEQIGGVLFRVLDKGSVITLSGPLGAGKTTFVRGFLREMGYQGNVKSPTYTLVEPYELPNGTVYHFDFYRLVDPEELELAGIRDYFESQAYCLIEWPEKGAAMIRSGDIHITIEFKGEQRLLHIQAASQRGKHALDKLENIK